MATVSISVNLATENLLSGGERLVTVQGTARYVGTRTGGPGSPNIEDYAVTIRGVECEGTWSGDARQNVRVDVCPESLRAELEKLYRSRERAETLREWSRMSAADREYFRACGMAPDGASY